MQSGKQPEVSRLGLGTSMLASWRGGLSVAAADRLISAAHAYGVTLIDTADTYASGECERLLGQLLKGRRDRFTLMTKAGYIHADLPGSLHHLNPLAKKILNRIGPRQCFDPLYLERSLHRSLARLQTDFIDIFVLHDPTLSCLEDGRVFEKLDSIQKAGFTRLTGVSSGDSEVLSLALAWPGCSVIQTPLQEHEGVSDALMQPAAARMQIVLNHVSLGGQLPGDITTASGSLSGVRAQISRRAAEFGVGLNAALLPVALEISGADSVLTGTRNVHHLIENAKAIQGMNQLIPTRSKVKDSRKPA